MSKKDTILQLHNEGKSYKEIATIAGCSKSLVRYYCGDGAKEQSLARQRRNRKNNVLLKKVGNFRRQKQSLADRANHFQTRGYNECVQNFNYKDVLAKFGENTTCYLTGDPISLMEPKTYSFDHIVPRAKGGSNSLDNLGILSKAANQAKSDLLVPELIELCVKILTHNGYICTK